MSRTALITAAVISILLIIAALAGWFWFLRQQTSALDTTTSTGFLSDFPAQGSGGSNGFGIFGSPLGGTDATTQQPTATAITTPTLARIYPDPVAGFLPYDTGENAIRTRIVDRATGDVYEYTHETENTVRIVRETIPRVVHATLTPNGRAMFRQYVDENETLVTVYTPFTAQAEGITSTPLQNGIQTIVPLSNSESFALVQRVNGVEGVVFSHETGAETKTLWESALSGWNAVAGNTNTVWIAQRASNNIPGVVYTVDTLSGAVTEAFSAVLGVSILPHPTAPTALFSRASDTTTSLFVFNATTRTERALPVRTIAEKCAWSTRTPTITYCAVPQTMPKNMPDTWYRGEVHTTDTWYRIDTQTGESTLLFEPGTEGAAIDVITPRLNATETGLFFVNNTDQSLWLLQLPAAQTTTSEAPEAL